MTFFFVPALIRPRQAARPSEKKLPITPEGARKGRLARVWRRRRKGKRRKKGSELVGGSGRGGGKGRGKW